jgi:hypothetical protein
VVVIAQEEGGGGLPKKWLVALQSVRDKDRERQTERETTVRLTVIHFLWMTAAAYSSGQSQFTTIKAYVIQRK